MRKGWLGILSGYVLLTTISVRPVLAIDAKIEALWQRNAPNGPDICSLSGAVAGKVSFRCIFTLNPGEFDPEIRRVVVKELPQPHEGQLYDGPPASSGIERTEGDN
jgi:hypothetical protein